jgi:hypothetical protein
MPQVTEGRAAEVENKLVKFFLKNPGATERNAQRYVPPKRHGGIDAWDKSFGALVRKGVLEQTLTLHPTNHVSVSRYRVRSTEDLGV